MAEPARPAAATPVAVVGLACRFPDADDPATLLDTVLAGRRAFRRLPPCRLDLADYYTQDRDGQGQHEAAGRPDDGSRDTIYSTRAGLIEGWQFDREAFRIPASAYAAADPAHWLALETAARALAAAGFPGGSGLDRDRIGVIIGNTLTGDTSRAHALRLRWPYVRRVLSESLRASDVRSDLARKVLRHAAARYRAPFPRPGEYTLAGSLPASIPAGIASYFGFRGGSQAVDGACASSLQAVTSACAALVAGEIDVALAGGVDVSLDPLELVGLARTGAAADGEVRIYDEHPTGYLPGEGCGVVVLMRAAQARAARLPVYAEIIGWGSSAGSRPGVVASAVSSQLLALRRAYERAGVDPRDVALIEGQGSGTSADDDAELLALSDLLAGARQPAALGSIKANIGHAKAAAGAAGLIKTVLAVGTGVIPPATGVVSPHPLLREAGSGLRLPEAAEEWPAGGRLAGVSAMDAGGTNVHLVLRGGTPARGSRYDRMLRVIPRLARTESAPEPAGTAGHRAGPARQPLPYLLHAADRRQLDATLARLAVVAGWLSDAELTDLACQLGRDARTQHPLRVAIVAGHQEELARLAGQARVLLPGLTGGLVTARPGIFAADGADGRVTLLASDEADASAGGRAASVPDAGDDAIEQLLSALRWLDSLEVGATAVVGHGLGEIAGLAWAGVLSQADVTEVAALRAEFLAGPSVRILAPAGRHASGRAAELPHTSEALELLRTALTQFRFGPPRRRLISTMTGRELASAAEVIDLICGGFAGQDRLAEAVAAGAEGASLLVETGPGQLLAATAARVCRVPSVSMDASPDDAAGASAAAASRDSRGRAQAGAALFAAGAIGEVAPLFAGLQGRPVDLWRDQVFITSPCQAPVPPQAGEASLAPAAAPTRRPRLYQASRGRHGDRPVARLHAAPVSAARAMAEMIETAAGSGMTRRTGTAGSAAPGTAAAGLARTRPAAPDAGRPDAASTATASTAAGGPAGAGTASRSSASAGHAVSRAGTALAGAGPAVSGPEPGQPGALAGVKSWTRCFTEEAGPPAAPDSVRDDQPWRLLVAEGDPLRAAAAATFGSDPAAARTLAVIGDPARPGAGPAALHAAQDALRTRRLVVVTTDRELTGFFGTLHAEHPELGVTVLRVPPTADGLRAARSYARAEPGEFRELIIAADGTARRPALAAVAVPGGGDFPLGAGDVVLVSRASGGAALALAQILACSGAAVAIVGQAGPERDAAVVAGLEELRLAGARITYEVVDTTSPADMVMAVQRIERRFGPVTAVAHAIAPCPPVPVAGLTERVLRDHLAAAHGALRDLLSPVAARRLRLILTVGSVAGRYGLPRQGLLAVTSTGLARQAAAVAGEITGCRALHVDLPGWARSGLGDEPGLAASMAESGTAALEVGDASRLLLKMLTSASMPASVAVHGRVDGPAAWLPGHKAPSRGAPGRPRPGNSMAGQPGAGRFLRDIRVHYPGIELVGDTVLSMADDPYLADYRVDGLPVLPPPMALEALAQAASALTGRPLRRAESVTMEAPVVLAGDGGQTLIRVCAVAEAGKVTAVLRCADSGMQVDHVRAEFPCGAEPAVAGGAAAADAALAAGHALYSGADGTRGQDEALGQDGMTAIVDGAELYGPVCFQSGRFRRIAILPEITARSCRALARGAEGHPWFPGGPAGAGPADAAPQAGPAPQASPATAAGLLLGSPGLNDTALQVLQACTPHRRVWLASCESVTFSGRMTDGPVTLRAVATERPAAPAARGRAPAGAGTAGPGLSGPVPAGSVPAPAPSQDQPAARPAAPLSWNVQALDSAGRPLVTWQGVRLREAGLMPRNSAWPAALLSVYLERGAAGVGLDPDLRVTVSCAAPDGPGQHGADAAGLPGPGGAAGGSEPGADLQAGAGSAASVVPPPRAGAQPGAAPGGPAAAHPALSGVPRQPGDPGAGAAATGTGQLAGYTLIASGTRFAACGWSVADPRHPVWPPGAEQAATFSRLCSHLSEPPVASAARLQAVAACLAMAQAPDGAPVTFRRVTADGWAVLEAAGTEVACTVVQISGVSCPVAIALLTEPPRRGGRAERAGARREADRRAGRGGHRLPSRR
ncbi:MAG TPA: beta-ketoacyl synthase N-terminal-like domain-containing protein [Streptosporangiaceae bacterium]|nr:beta-ketoacyl synthase N-terminal-like domain-containing protein [Streptosporangiaceae bacterium]